MRLHEYEFVLRGLTVCDIWVYIPGRRLLGVGEWGGGGEGSHAVPSHRYPGVPILGYQSAWATYISQQFMNKTSLSLLKHNPHR